MGQITTSPKLCIKLDLSYSLQGVRIQVMSLNCRWREHVCNNLCSEGNSNSSYWLKNLSWREILLFLLSFLSFIVLKLNTLVYSSFYIGKNKNEISGSKTYFSFMTIQFQSFFPKSHISDKGSHSNFETVEGCSCQRPLISYIQIRLFLKNENEPSNNKTSLFVW